MTVVLVHCRDFHFTLFILADLEDPYPLLSLMHCLERISFIRMYWKKIYHCILEQYQSFFISNCPWVSGMQLTKKHSCHLFKTHQGQQKAGYSGPRT